MSLVFEKRSHKLSKSILFVVSNYQEGYKADSFFNGLNQLHVFTFNKEKESLFLKCDLEEEKDHEQYYLDKLLNDYEVKDVFSYSITKTSEVIIEQENINIYSLALYFNESKLLNKEYIKSEPFYFNFDKGILSQRYNHSTEDYSCLLSFFQEEYFALVNHTFMHYFHSDLIQFTFPEPRLQNIQVCYTNINEGKEEIYLNYTYPLSKGFDEKDLKFFFLRFGLDYEITDFHDSTEFKRFYFINKEYERKFIEILKIFYLFDLTHRISPYFYISNREHCLTILNYREPEIEKKAFSLYERQGYKDMDSKELEELIELNIKS